jgi:predicted esterase
MQIVKTIFFGVLAIVVLGGGVIQAQPAATNLPAGRVIDKVTCTKTPTQSYAVYLPTTYSPARPWPVLYAFDPGAHGPLPVERFREAAEKYGWIIVGSNNSHNGSMQQSLDAWAAMWDDTHERFAIDAQRVYAGGFSGGARVAIYFARLCRDCIAGVIACGAGFPQGIQPSSDLRFKIFGVAGVDDFNFPEMRDLDGALTRAGVGHVIDSFEGRHDWPPASEAAVAIAWIELEAMKAGRRPRDQKLIAQLWQAQMERANSFAAAKNVLDQYRTSAAMVESFNGLAESQSFITLRSELAKLATTRDVKDALHEERKQVERQQAITQQLSQLLAQPGNAEMETENQLRSLLSSLRDDSKAANDSGNRRVARRVLEGMMVGLFERGVDQMQRQKHYADAIRSFATATQINPDRAGAFYYLASAYALNGDTKKALQALQTAIQKGFADREAIATNTAFESLRNERVYIEILQKLM